MTASPKALTHLALRRPALTWAVTLGILADSLVRVPGRPGLNVALWALVGVVVLVMLLRQRCEAPAREALWLIGGAFLFAVALVLRDSESLALVSLFAAVVLLTLAAGRS